MQRRSVYEFGVACGVDCWIISYCQMGSSRVSGVVSVLLAPVAVVQLAGLIVMTSIGTAVLSWLGYFWSFGMAVNRH